MKLRPTAFLLATFAALLGAMLWFEYADVPTRKERQLRAGRMLPELVDAKPAEVRRIEIDRGTEGEGKGNLVFARAEGVGWKMLEPADALADNDLIETLVRNLKEMGPSRDAGTITDDDPAPYGLKTPEAVIRVYLREEKAPAATLQLGKSKGDRLYVRTGEGGGIEVADARLFTALRLPAYKWRDKALFHLPSYRVASLSVTEPDASRDFKVERGEGRWRMVKPVKAPAEDEKVEGLVAEISALRVADSSDAYVADDVKDFAPYGLDKPLLTLEIAPFGAGATPQTLLFGKDVPGHPGQVYAMRKDQNDVVRLDVKVLRESLPGPTGLRSKKAVDVFPARVVRLRVEGPGGKPYDLTRSNGEWRQLSPMKTKADGPTVSAFIARLADLKSTEFLDPKTVPDSGLDAPSYRIKLWQLEAGGSGSSSAETSDTPKDPTAELEIGRHDLFKKTLYARVPGDKTVLALPDTFAASLPKDPFAFRERTVLAVRPEKIRRLTIDRMGHSVTVESPGSGSTALHWKMIKPVAAKADDAAITGLAVLLSNLHAEGFESAPLGDGRAWGLDRPWLKVSWSADATPGPSPSASPADPTAADSGTLRVGAKTPKGDNFFAVIEGDDQVFRLTQAQVATFQTDVRDKLVMSFPPDKLEKVTITWPTRSLAVGRGPTKKGEPPDWRVEPGYDGSGIDLTHFSGTLLAVNELKAVKFLFDGGLLPKESGLFPARLELRFYVKGEPGPRILRIGNAVDDTQVLATSTEGPEGPLFLIPMSPAWSGLLREPGRANDLPDDPFAAAR